MDRARHAGAQGPGVGAAGDPGGALTARRLARAAALVVAAIFILGCGQLGTDLDQVVAIVVGFPDSAAVEEGDTIIPFAKALNGRGDSVAATVYWAAIDTALIAVLDSATGATLGKKPASGARLLARVGNLRSNPLPVAVRPQADTVVAPGALRDTVTASTSVDSLSDSLTVRLQDLTTTPGTPVGLVARPVAFTITYPIGGSGFTLVPPGTVLTGAGGIAAVRVKLVNRALPDSVVVTATALRANGQPVPGSGVTFVVEYLP